jgi:hypothetical protein
MSVQYNFLEAYALEFNLHVLRDDWLSKSIKLFKYGSYWNEQFSVEPFLCDIGLFITQWKHSNTFLFS